MTDKTTQWEKLPSGDWYFWLEKGGERRRAGAVVYQDFGGKRRWTAVSTLLEKGPDEVSGLTAGKRLVESWLAESEAQG